MIKLVVCFAIISIVAGDSQVSVPSLDGRIVGGSDTDIANHPHQVSLQYLSRHICGGAIISSTWILTASHCIVGVIIPSLLTVRLGTTTVSSGGIVKSVLAIIGHPYYNGSTYDYDIALLQLSSAITFSSVARAIDIPSSASEPNAGETATITGWGTLSYGGSSPSILQEVQVPVINQTACQEAYSPANISPRMLCAGLLGVGGKDACQGDSGGPLVVNGILYGLVSWGYGCAEANYPGVYTNLADLRQWVLENTGNL